MSILNQFPVRRPLKRTPISGSPLLLGYPGLVARLKSRYRRWLCGLTHSQRIALRGLKILAQAFALFLLAITLLWLWPILDTAWNSR